MQNEKEKRKKKKLLLNFSHFCLVMGLCDHMVYLKSTINGGQQRAVIRKYLESITLLHSPPQPTVHAFSNLVIPD